jgi:hypothetical protein
MRLSTIISWVHIRIWAWMHGYLRVVCVGGQRGQSRVAGLGSYSTIMQGGRKSEAREHMNIEYRVGFHHHHHHLDETTLRVLRYVPVRHDHLIIRSYTAEGAMIDNDIRSYEADVDRMRHGIASHRIASHRIASRRIASHRIA